MSRKKSFRNVATSTVLARVEQLYKQHGAVSEKFGKRSAKEQAWIKRQVELDIAYAQRELDQLAVS